MPNVTPLPIQAPPDRHPALVVADGIMAHVPGAQAAIDEVLRTLRTSGSLPPRLVELLRIRIAFHNQCRVCMAGRYLPSEVDEDLVCSLERPADAPGLSDAEREALRFGDLFATDHLSINAATYDGLREHFTESQLVELGLYCSYLVGQGRLSATWRIDEQLPPGFQADPGSTVAPWGHAEVLVLVPGEMSVVENFGTI
jgi:alkylhydroperoxidase family enzyme